VERHGYFWVPSVSALLNCASMHESTDADIDTRPKCFKPLTHIGPDDEMYTMSDNEGPPPFHFTAAMPKHALVLLVVQHGLEFVLQVHDTGSFNPARLTGPKAMKKAMRTFLNGYDDAQNTPDAHIQSKDDNFIFHGMGGLTTRREGPPDVSNTILSICHLALRMCSLKETTTKTRSADTFLINVYRFFCPIASRWGSLFRLGVSSSCITRNGLNLSSKPEPTCISRMLRLG
jgi:hypothetical protein